MSIHEVLIKYWGYPKFRPNQEEIIQSVLSGEDTLALLPTGGGKSICFQVPTIANEGLCVVISPLIALMKDQVENLEKRGIKALAVTSALTSREIDIALDNCIYGDYKFLYVSPERLGTILFKERFKKMKVNLIAVDEAHCISQWGYDFRPSYLNIAEIRTLKPEVPVLALTATATPDVVEDIQDKLDFKQTKVIQSSFERKNLAYVCLNEEDKMKRCLSIISNVGGTGVIYVRNRKKTKEIAQFLQKKGYSADFYHAGLHHSERNKKQADWSNGKLQIIVSTNAFGMGIDVPHVRFVVHLDLPDSIEAYFQEAGRAGRDGKKAYAVLLFNNTDKLLLQERNELNFPPLEEIKRTYTALGNFFQIPVGGGRDNSFDFDLSSFNQRYDFKSPAIVYSSLNYLEKEGLISSTEAVYNPSKIMVKAKKDELYRFQVKHPLMDPVIKVVLRSYTGIFENFVKISEAEIALKSKQTEAQIIRLLNYLHQHDLIHYIPKNNSPKITFVQERKDENHLNISKPSYIQNKKNALNKAMAVWNYAENQNRCRSLQLLEYFGEKNIKRCGICDYCLERNKVDVNQLEFEQIRKEVLELLKNDTLNIQDLSEKVTKVNKEKVVHVIQWLLEHDKIQRKKDGKLTSK